MKTKFILKMVLVFGVFSIGQMAFAGDANDRHSQQGFDQFSITNAASAFIEAAGEGSLDPRTSASLANRILAGIHNEEDKLKQHSTHDSRRTAATRILGKEAYERLEECLLLRFQSGTNTGDILVALNMLGKVLSSKNAESFIEEKLRNDLANLTNEDGTEDSRADVLFAEAEALSYLGNSKGIEVLSSALNSKHVSSQKKCAAIRALNVLATARAQAALQSAAPDLLGSDSSIVAYCALDTLSCMEDLSGKVVHGARTQLQRLTELFRKHELDDDDLGLLLKTSLILRHAAEKEGLSPQDKAVTRSAVSHFLCDGTQKEQEFVVSLLSQLAEVEDADLIGKLLKSESPKVRTEGVRSLLHCGAVLEKRFLPDLVHLIDDPDQYTRDLALYVIRKYKGEKTTNMLPEEEFKKEAARIKSWWSQESKKGS